MTTNRDATPPAGRPAVTTPSRHALPTAVNAAVLDLPPGPRRLVALGWPAAGSRLRDGQAALAEHASHGRHALFADGRDRLPRNGFTLPAVAPHKFRHRGILGT